MMNIPFDCKLALCLTYLAYASSYFLRKPFTLIKEDVALEYDLTNREIGFIDSSFLLPYAFGQVLLGSLGDKYNPKKIICVGLMGSSTAMFFFGHTSNWYLVVNLMIINGFCQSLLWPNCVKAVSGHMDKTLRARIYGLWGSSSYIGSFTGTLLSMQLIQLYGWKNVFVVPSVLVFMIAVLNVLFLKVKEEDPNKIKLNQLEERHKEQVSIIDGFKTPGVLLISMSFFCTKLVRYSLMMWLPMYLSTVHKFSFTEAATLSLIFDIGGIGGSVLAPSICLKFLQNRQIFAVAIYLATAVVSFFSFVFTCELHNFYIIGLQLLIIGCCCNSIDMLISGPIATSLGENEGRNIQATVAGICNGIGSLGSSCQGVFVGYISHLYGWESVFHSIIVLCILALVLVLPLFNLDRKLAQDYHMQLSTSRNSKETVLL